VIEAVNLRKTHGAVCSVDGVSFSIHGGETVGLFGPNGSGKSSLLRLLLGIDRPTAGSVLYHGVDFAAAVRHGFQARLITADAIGPLGMSAARHMGILARLAGLTHGAAEYALDRVGLADRSRSNAASFSMGMRQRLALACGWLGECDFLVMDEPTNSLDAGGPSQVTDLARHVASGGGAVLIASHDAALLATTCDCILIIEHGRVSDEIRLAGGVDDVAGFGTPPGEGVLDALRASVRPSKGHLS
jgi:ABC-2 type transport system ATP-binding protein